MIQEFSKIKKVNGTLFIPGDKSISHRAVMFSCMAKGESVISNLSKSFDVNSTLNCFSELGVTSKWENEKLFINGLGYKNLNPPNKPLDAGNSGTTARLISGILAAQDFGCELIGDESLSIRPMMRVVNPLREMNAEIETSADGTLPVKISYSKKFKNIEYTLPIASAQVKSCVLLAGLHLEKDTTVIEKEKTRNHTEVMLGLDVEEHGDFRIIKSNNSKYPVAHNYFIPGDISSAAFFIVLTLVLENSELMIKNISLNPTRTGVLTVLKQMGANIKIFNEQTSCGEVYGDLFVKSSKLKNVKIDKAIIANIIDEIPILTIAGIFADGDFEISGAEELRKKESDRITTVVENIKKLGLEISEFEDGYSIKDTKCVDKEIQFESYGDHRIAMAFAVYSLIACTKSSINNFECAGVSNPEFINQIKSIS